MSGRTWNARCRRRWIFDISCDLHLPKRRGPLARLLLGQLADIQQALDAVEGKPLDETKRGLLRDFQRTLTTLQRLRRN